MTTTIYYLPGHGGLIGTGLGEGLLGRGFDVTGRETVGAFKELAFTDQVATIAQDLQSSFWNEDALVVANSYGAYLFLHSQLLMKPYVGKVLLLSPIVGQFSDNEGTGVGFIPPFSERLVEVVASGKYPVPKNCEIHVGELDWQSNPANVIRIFGPLGLSVTFVPQTGHMLGKSYVSGVLDAWFGQGGRTGLARSSLIYLLDPR